MQRLRIDFLNRRPPASLLGWALTLVGVASMAVAALDYAQARDELQSTLDHAERQARGSKQRARGNAAPAVAPELVRASARADAALSQPWGRLLRELETVADTRVALLGVEAQGAARTLRITAEAATMAEAVDYVERLRQSALTKSAVLGSHEWRNADGVAVIRFSVDMAWGSAFVTPNLGAHLRFALQRHGWPAPLGVLLVLLAVALAHWGADGARSQAEALRASLASEQERVARQPDPATEQASRIEGLQRQLPDAAAALEAVQFIHRSAAEHGVTLANGEYRLVREGGTRLQRYQITLPADGDYPALRAWLGEVLNRLPSIALDDLSLSRGSAGENRVEARVRWSFYLRTP